MVVDYHAFLMALLGGLMIGVASALLMLFNGRIAGISGIMSGILKPSKGEFSWRLAFFGGLLLGGAVLFYTTPSLFPESFNRSLPATAAAGLLVGFGTRLGSGCTSGHGICGVSRLSPRSMVATVTFIATGAIMVFLTNLIFGGSI